jgi:peptidoglycan/xylan/chitin deacetylase (PgdA/CDA1 family)
MRFLKRHYTVITPEQLVAVQCEGGTLPRNAVLLTFDDGYRDVYERAYPVLKDLGLRAFLFPATDYVGGSRPFPHDERLPMPNPVLNWSQLRAMDDVFAIGSHTRSHRVLTRLPRNEAEEEIVASKALIEDRLGRPVQFFCYPKGATGDFSQPLEDIVEAAGYRGSFVTLTGPNTVPAVRRGKWLRRYHVDPLGGFTFARLLDGSCDAIGLKDLSWGVAAKRRFNAWLGTMTR